MGYLLIQTTVATEKEANALATTLLEKRLAACVQVSQPIKGVYRWEGKITSSEEFVVTLKSHRKMWDAIKTFFEKNHSYALPEMIGTEILVGSKEYLEWLDAQLKPLNS